ncbi:MAG: hypothetical protein J6C93_06390 [Clostridia bacterium]|nr:hypothetical protein [Clostridia bacterium]
MPSKCKKIGASFYSKRSLRVSAVGEGEISAAVSVGFCKSSSWNGKRGKKKAGASSFR